MNAHFELSQFLKCFTDGIKIVMPMLSSMLARMTLSAQSARALVLKTSLEARPVQMSTMWMRSFSMMPKPVHSHPRWVLPTSLPPVTKPPATPLVHTILQRILTLPLRSIILRTPYNADPTLDVLQAMNRNNRAVKRANGGQRPCNRRSRRAKKRAFGNHRRGRG